MQENKPNDQQLLFFFAFLCITINRDKTERWRKIERYAEKKIPLLTINISLFFLYVTSQIEIIKEKDGGKQKNM